MPPIIPHRTIDGVERKRCSTCNEWHVLGNYTRKATRADGLCDKCKTCWSEYRRERADMDREYRANNRDKVNLWKQNERRRALDNHSESVIRRRVKENISRRLRLFLGGQKSRSTMDLVGCTVEDLKAHLESTWTDGMSWKNYGVHGWHIDHKLPCASFDHEDEEQVARCWNWTNLQALWAEDNLKKGARVL